MGQGKGCFNMSRMIGTVSRGVRAPIIRSGDDIVEIVTSSVLDAAKDGKEAKGQKYRHQYRQNGMFLIEQYR